MGVQAYAQVPAAFIVGVLLVPSAVSLVWFAIFGGGAIGIQERAEQAGNTSAQLSQIVEGAPDINFDLILFDMLGALPLPQVLTIIVFAVTVILIAIFFVTGADSASIVMGTLSERGTAEPSKKSIIFWGVAVGASAAAMLLAGGDVPAEALNGIKNITIVSALPFVIVMLLLCVAIWKDLSRDPLMLQDKIARIVLEDSVSEAVQTHQDGGFGLVTKAIAVQAASPRDADGDGVPDRLDAAPTVRAESPEDPEYPGSPGTSERGE